MSKDPLLQYQEAIGNQTSQAISIEWVVTYVRWAVLLVFLFIRKFKVVESQPGLESLYFFILLGSLYNLYVIYVLHTGVVKRALPHFLSFFISTDILLLVALVYFSNIYEHGLLLFYYFLIIIVALRESFKLSLILGPIMVAAYIFSSYLVFGTEHLLDRKMILEILGLLALSGFCGWFSEGKSRAWNTMRQLKKQLKMANKDLGETQRRLDLYKRLESLRRNFVAIMSHELRTPLTGIIGYNDLLLMEEAGPLNERQKGFLTDMLDKSDSLLGLIDNLLDLSKIQSGRWDLNLRHVNPARLIEKAVSSVIPSARKKGVRIIQTASEATKLPEIIADAEKIERVILNIVHNAVKFSPEGGTVTISAEIGFDASLSENFPYLISSTQVITFSIADNGPGIPKGEQQLIFDRFYQVRSKEGVYFPGGVGLGLSIAKEIVELHWGKIWYEDIPSGGSVFNFTLPVNPLRLCRKIALIKNEFNCESLMQGLIFQFEDEIKRKELSINKEGWPGVDDRLMKVRADRQLLQCVIFNILNNQIRYAFPGSELDIAMGVLEELDQFYIRIENRGESINPEILKRISCGEKEVDDPLSRDLRRASVNLNLAQDIIESHGGTFFLDDLDGQGVALSINLPLFSENGREGTDNEDEKNLDS